MRDYVITRAEETENDLTHWKYVSKKKVNGKWKYKYSVGTDGYNDGKDSYQKNLRFNNNETGGGVTVGTGKSKSLNKYLSLTVSSGKGSSNAKDYKQINKKIGNFRVTGEYNKKIKYLDVAVSYKNPKVKKSAAKGKTYATKFMSQAGAKRR